MKMMKNIPFNILFLFNQEKTEGTIIVTILVIFLLIVFIWYLLVFKPNEKKKFKKWLEETNDFFFVKDEIKNLLKQLSEQITPCNKCKNSIFQIWDIDELITFRCINCKKKKDFEINPIEDIKLVFNIYFNLFNKKNITDNALIKDFLNNYLDDNLNTVRKGNSLYSVFKIIAKKKEEESFDKKTELTNRHISQKVKNQVWNRDKGKCIECGSNEKLEFDHIIPFSKGGSNTYRNIQLLCESCNRIKSNKIG